MKENRTQTIYKVHDQYLLNREKLFQIVNATVSHEMRNPINAIQAQNIKL